MELLILPYQPVRYMVTNTEKVILVTHDFKYANKIAAAIRHLENPKDYIFKIK